MDDYEDLEFDFEPERDSELSSESERAVKSLEQRTVRLSKDQLKKMPRVPCLNLDDLRETAAYSDITNIGDDGYIVIECEPVNKPFVCQSCKKSGFIVRNGYTSQPRLVHDVNIGLTQVDLLVRVPKYTCKNCGASPNHEFESIEHNRQFTKRLMQQIKCEAFTGNFDVVATKFGLSSSNVGYIFDMFARELEAKRGSPKVGWWLAIDEKHIDHKMRGVLVDGCTGELLELTEENSPEKMKRAIMSLKGYENVRFITTDMANGYRKMLDDIYGSDVMIVVDKWHVLNDLSTKLSKCRTAIIEYLNTTVPKEPDTPAKARRMEVKKMTAQDGYLFKYGPKKLEENQSRAQRLAEVCSVFPEYNHLRLLKIGFERIYKAETIEQALALFDEWKVLVPPSGAKQRVAWEAQYHVRSDLYTPICTLKRTVEDLWHNEIFNYFRTGTERRLTNAIAEAVNSSITRFTMNGYSFERLRAKVLFWHVVGARTRYVLETRKVQMLKSSSTKNESIGYSIGLSSGFDDLFEDVPVYGIFEEKDPMPKTPLSVLQYLNDDQKAAWNSIVESL